MTYGTAAQVAVAGRQYNRVMMSYPTGTVLCCFVTEGK